MGILILGQLCMAAEVFLIYFLVQLFRDSRREKRQLHSNGEHALSHTQQYMRFDVTPPVAKAVWDDGHWRRVDLSGSTVTESETETDSLHARRHA